MAINNVINLSVGDVVVLEKKFSEPIDLLINDRKGFYGFPVTCRGKCAVAIAPRIKQKD